MYVDIYIFTLTREKKNQQAINSDKNSEVWIICWDYPLFYRQFADFLHLDLTKIWQNNKQKVILEFPIYN